MKKIYNSPKCDIYKVQPRHFLEGSTFTVVMEVSPNQELESKNNGTGINWDINDDDEEEK